ncbi:MAG: energy-coupling factor ABC transporter ATP-binding protein [Planifilum sp.]|jgi:energy-coupling factor transport system ATP-binding protein
MSRVVVKDVCFSYRSGEEVLKGITLDFDEKSTAIIGQNGAGKTTFVKLLKGLLKPTRGEIYILGRSANEMTAAALAPFIGLVFQNPNDQIFRSTVLEEVMFGPLNIGEDPKGARKKAEEALEMVGLTEKASENPHDLRLSEKKLVCVASIVAMEPEILILDEPTIAQDHAGMAAIRQVIRRFKEQGKLVMGILHDMDFAAENFERVVVFHQGTVVADDDPREVFSRESLLQRAGLEVPHITRLGWSLGRKETFLTEAELIQSLRGEGSTDR